MEKTSFLGIPLSTFTFSELADQLNSSIEKKEHLTICNINIHAINQFKKNLEFRKALLDSDFVICDSDIIRILSAIFKRKKVYKLTGSRWVTEYLNQNHLQLKIFLLGDETPTLIKCSDYIKKLPGVSEVAIQNGFFDGKEIEKVKNKINEFKPDILLVGMGMPKQEIFIDLNKNDIVPCIAIPVGGAFKYWAGIYKQAPQIMLILNLEWLHRIYQEPIRLGKRYFLDSVFFIKNLIFHFLKFN